MKLDWRHITLIVLSVLLVIMILLLVLMISSRDGKKDVKESSVISAEESELKQEESTELQNSGTIENAESSKVVENSEQSNNKENKEEDQQLAQQGETINTQKEESKVTDQQEERPTSIQFPYTIPGTSLVVNQFNSYDGVFLEDGSDAEVTGISTIIVENVGGIGVEYADIVIDQSGTPLKFTASAIPAGTTIVIQEANGAAYSDSSIQECSANVALIENFEMSSSMVEVVENERGSLSVTNLGSETIPCVRIFYKFALEKGSIYVGGITYTAKITELEPGVTQDVAPSHYVAGSSEIMMVRTYDTAE